MSERSSRREVRNPLLLLPAARTLTDLPEPARAALEQMLREISADARGRADKCWRTHKAPMAAYWKMIAVVARHAACACRRPTIDRISG